jgi:hypothetical protein
LSDPDGQHISGYDAAVAERLLAEAANVMRSLGFAANHIVLIGGHVPSLLVPVLDPGVEPHVGTADIDLCLSVALVEGTTGMYERIESVLKRLGFTEADASFRWRRRTDLPLTIEFFCPADASRPAGHTYRPTRADNPTGKHNFGGRLSALALEAGEILTTDVEIVRRRVTLPDGSGIANTELRVTGPVAFLAAKAKALDIRDKRKDAYDIVWLIESWPGGPAAAARAFSERPAFSCAEVERALHSIGDAFASTDHVGARSYARFVAGSPAEELQLERRAVGAIREFFDALPPRH